MHGDTMGLLGCRSRPRLSSAAAGLLLATVIACGGASDTGSGAPSGGNPAAASTPTPDPTPTPVPFTCGGTIPPGFRVVGYMPSWHGNVEQVDFARLTHVNYAFALPTAAGGLEPVDNLAKLDLLVSSAHASGVQVLISIGGWNDGDDSAFTTLASTAAGRRAFAQAVAAFVSDHDLDGADIDWEVPEPADRNNYREMIHELALALHPTDKRLTAAVGASDWGGGGIDSATFADFDFVNIMAYDGGSGADHSPYSYAVSALDYWAGRGLPAQKTVLGVPFYSRPGWRSYAWLVATYPEAPFRDEVGGEHYNGMDTIKRKTCLAGERAWGVMIWELSQDTHDWSSLLSAIDSVVTD